MLAFVSEEVERLKVMFTSKEQRLVSERDSALSEHESALRDADSLRVKIQAAELRVEGMSAEVQVRGAFGIQLPCTDCHLVQGSIEALQRTALPVLVAHHQCYKHRLHCHVYYRCASEATLPTK